MPWCDRPWSLRGGRPLGRTVLGLRLVGLGHRHGLHGVGSGWRCVLLCRLVFVHGHGVVSRRTVRVIQVAVEEWPESERLRLDLSMDETTRRKQLAALQAVEHSRGRLGELRKTFLGERPPRFGRIADCEFRLQLNASQQRAVEPQEGP